MNARVRINEFPSMNITYKLNPISKSFTSKNKAEMFCDEKTVHLHARSFILML